MREAHDDADMQPGHRQQMRQAGIAEAVVVGRRIAILEPGQQRHRDRAGGAGIAAATARAMISRSRCTSAQRRRTALPATIAPTGPSA